jgi:polyphosphate kinase
MRTIEQPGRTPAPGISEIAPTDLELELYLNRELTYLNFCYRVLQEADDERSPLLERMKFLAIVSSNVDEFFQKRIGGLKQQVGAQVHSVTPDGRTPQQQIADALDLITKLETRKNEILDKLLGELKAVGVWLAPFKDLDEKERAWVREHYLRNIFPLVTPQAMDPAHPFPFVSNLSLNLLVSLRYANETDSESLLARVKVPVGGGMSRYVRLGSSRTFVDLADVMANNLDLLFPGMEIERARCFASRNAIAERRRRSRRLARDDRHRVAQSQVAPVVRSSRPLDAAAATRPHRRRAGSTRWSTCSSRRACSASAI